MTSPGDASLIRPPLWSGWRPGEEGGRRGGERGVMAIQRGLIMMIRNVGVVTDHGGR